MFVLNSVGKFYRQKVGQGIIDQAGSLMDADQFEAAKKILLPLAETDPGNRDVYWMLSCCFFGLGDETPIEEKKRKMQNYQACVDWAQKGYERNPEVAENLLFLAGGLGKQLEIGGMAYLLGLKGIKLKDIEAYLIEATQSPISRMEANAANSISAAHMGLGMLYRSTPDFVIVRLLQGLKGDINKSVFHNREAVAISPQNIEHKKELGVSLICRGQKKKRPAEIEEGKAWLKKALAIPAADTKDRIDHQDCRRLLDDPDLACRYTRSKQLDEVKF